MQSAICLFSESKPFVASTSRTASVSLQKNNALILCAGTSMLPICPAHGYFGPSASWMSLLVKRRAASQSFSYESQQFQLVLRQGTCLMHLCGKLAEVRCLLGRQKWYITSWQEGCRVLSSSGHPGQRGLQLSFLPCPS